MNETMRRLLYVHDYGNWHIAVKKASGAPLSMALCGAEHQRQKDHWASQRHFDPPELVIEDRAVCWRCLYVLPEEAR